MGLKIPETKTKNFARPLSGDLRADFSDFLAAHGMILDEKKGLVVGGDIGRAYMEVNGRKKLVGWYQVWIDQEVPFGRCGDRTVSNDEPIATWRPENSERYEMTEEQREEIRRLSEQAARDKEARHQKAAEKAKELWDSYPEATDDHSYLVRKNVVSHGLRVDRDRLVIPVLDAKLKIVGLQYIDGDGGKKFLPGTRKKGSFFVIDANNMRTAHTINYVEGYATGASYFADLGQPVVVCFDAFNLTPVAETISGYFPSAKHVFIADADDSQTGEKEAVKAAQAVRAKGAQADVLIPKELGDYNDHAVEGELLPELRSVEVPAHVEWSKSDKGKMLNVKENVRAVLEINQIEVRYNVIKKDLEITVPHQDFVADLQKDAALVEIENRCRHMGVPATNVRDYLKLLAVEYNPVKDWIDSKPWDGTSRLPRFLGTIKSSNEPLKKMLMSKWLLSCVAAVYEPSGVALEGILVFQGEQGLGKTLWFKRLADYDKGWLLEGATLNPSDKDSVKQAVSHWIVELGEIESTFKKSDIDQLKAFVTKKGDELRLPYDRAFTSYQRRTAFYASVNAREFLTDTSGNRRFWVVPVIDIQADHGIDMQQLWAEVKETMYLGSKHDWFLSKAERDMLQDSNESYRTQSSVEDLILQHVNFQGVNTRPVQMTQLLRDLGISQPRVPDVKDASRVLNAHGMEPRRSNGKKVYDLEYTKVEVGNADKFVSSWNEDF